MEAIVAPRDIEAAGLEAHNDGELAGVGKAEGRPLGRAENGSVCPHALIVEVEMAVDELAELDGPSWPPDCFRTGAGAGSSKPDGKPDFVAHGARQ